MIGVRWSVTVAREVWGVGGREYPDDLGDEGGIIFLSALLERMSDMGSIFHLFPGLGMFAFISDDDVKVFTAGLLVEPHDNCGNSLFNPLLTLLG